MRNAIHQSYWLEETPLEARYPPLTGQVSTEILVVGAGISGLSIAKELASLGRRVVVCDALTIGAGTTGGSSGHLDFIPEMGLSQLKSKLGLEVARDYVRLRKEAIDQIETVADQICDCVRLPAYLYSEREKDENSLRKDYEAAMELGIDATWSKEIPFPRAAVGYQIQGMGRIDTAKYIRQLEKAAVENGVKIYENTLVDGATEKNATSLKTGSGQVKFQHVIWAVHSNYTAALRIYAATPAYQSYVAVVRTKAPLTEALFWDNSDPYYYSRRASTQDPHLLLIGGRDHRTGTEDGRDAIRTLDSWIMERFPDATIASHWSAELFEPTDGLPMIGKAYGENMWVVTGLSGIGLTLGTVASKIIAEALNGAQSKVAEAFSPSRFGLSDPVTWLGEQAVTAKNLAERVLPAKKIDPSTLQVGEGSVGKVDGKHVAVCRDRNNCLYRKSPLCTHMGGVLHWNAVEQTWDCPVHGGRFKSSGSRLYGPPEDDLEDA